MSFITIWKQNQHGCRAGYYEDRARGQPGVGAHPTGTCSLAKPLHKGARPARYSRRQGNYPRNHLTACGFGASEQKVTTGSSFDTYAAASTPF